MEPTNIQPKSVEELDNIPDIDYNKIKKCAAVLRILSHKLRQLIITTIYKRKRITVTELYIKLRVEQSVMSQHLGILRKARIVLANRDGKFIYYTVNSSRMQEINRFSKGPIGN